MTNLNKSTTFWRSTTLALCLLIGCSLLMGAGGRKKSKSMYIRMNEARRS